MLAQAQEPAAAADRRFFTAMSLAALAIVFIGFSTTYYLWPFTRATHHANGHPISASLPLIVHVHAIAFTVWILLLVAQVALVASGRTATHRRVGTAAGWLVPILVLTGFLTAIRGVRDGWNPAPVFADALSFMVVPVMDIVVFAALVLPGLAYRRRPDVHKRLMLLATVGGLLPPAITRMPLVAGRPLAMFGIFSALVLAPAVRDYWRGSRTRLLSLFVGLGVLVSVLVRPFIGSTGAWRAVAAWFVS